MILFLFLYIVSFLLCVLLAKLNKGSKNYDNALQAVFKAFTPIPLMNTFIAIIGILRVVICVIANSEKTKAIRDFYNRLFD